MTKNCIVFLTLQGFIDFVGFLLLKRYYFGNVFNTMEMQRSIKKHQFAFVIPLLIVTAVAIGIYIYTFKNHSLSDNSEDWGTFGDYMGGVVGTIFTIIAALFVWLTYESQKEQLVLAKETAIKERFETTFFHMVSELRKIPDNIEGHVPIVYNDEFVPHKKHDESIVHDNKYLTLNHTGLIRVDYVKGNMFFSHTIYGLKAYYKKYLSFYKDGKRKINTIYLKNIQERKQPFMEEKIIDLTGYEEELYNSYYKVFLTEIDHYYRFFYNILKFIDMSEVQDKKLYADLLQAQLSKYELALIFYNGIGRIGKPKLFPLLEKYNFLENTNPNTIYKDHHNLYPQTTFRFLPEEEKNTIIANAIQDNPDKVTDAKRTDYYLRKYNRDSREEIKKLKAECEKMEGKENVTKLLTEAELRFT